MSKHDECIERGFSSSVEFKELLSYEQGEDGNVEILFEEVCERCGTMIGSEIQTFKYIGRREV